MALSAGWEDFSRVLLKTTMNWNAKGTNQDKPLAV